MVVDDDQSVLDVTVEMLENAGFTVTGCNDSTKALDMLGDLAPDLLITDVCMPQITGTQLLQTMRKFEVETPVIIMTGYAELNMVIEAIRNDVFDVITKPIGYGYLIKSAANAIDHRKQMLKLYELTRTSEGPEYNDSFLFEIGVIANDLFRKLNQLKAIEDRNLENRHLDPARAQANRLLQLIETHKNRR